MNTKCFCCGMHKICMLHSVAYDGIAKKNQRKEEEKKSARVKRIKFVQAWDNRESL